MIESGAPVEGALPIPFRALKATPRPPARRALANNRDPEDLSYLSQTQDFYCSHGLSAPNNPQIMFQQGTPRANYDPLFATDVSTFLNSCAHKNRAYEAHATEEQR